MNKCVLPVVSVGVVPPGHSTPLNHVMVPLVWVSSSVKAKARLAGVLLTVKVLFPLIVLVK
jgi:hypothetical protein